MAVYAATVFAATGNVWSSAGGTAERWRSWGGAYGDRIRHRTLIGPGTKVVDLARRLAARLDSNGAPDISCRMASPCWRSTRPEQRADPGGPAGLSSRAAPRPPGPGKVGAGGGVTRIQTRREAPALARGTRRRRARQSGYWCAPEAHLDLQQPPPSSSPGSRRQTPPRPGAGLSEVVKQKTGKAHRHAGRIRP